MGGLQNHNQTRLDRFLITQDWMDHFGSISQPKIPKPTSDHAPILLECGGGEKRVDPFLF